MIMRRRPMGGLVFALLLVGVLFAATGISHADVAPDSLELRAPENFRVWREFKASESRFVVYMTWDDVPDSCGTFIHQPDTTGWAVEHLSSEMSMPSSGGVYSGDIDRTVSFRSRDTGRVGEAPEVRIRYEIRKEEYLNGEIDVGVGYQPGDAIPLIFRNSLEPGVTVDLGITVSFSAGWVDRQGGFLLGVEDFEGYHIWRGIQSDGSDLEVIGELSKEEAFKGDNTGGSFVDSVYYYSVIPSLRYNTVPEWCSPFGTIDCLGRCISLKAPGGQRIRLGEDELMWYDCNAFNGFTYYYAVTTFDRDYEVLSGRQGLFKFDNCQPAQGALFPCEEELQMLTVEVDAQEEVSRVYAVPNPFRSGGSRLTQENYHNFPDDMVRFVNVPEHAIIKIFNVAGDLVWEGGHDGLDGNIEWGVANMSNEPVASGVYIYRVESDGGNVVYGRLVVIR